MKFTCDYVTEETFQEAGWLISKYPGAFIKIPYHHLPSLTSHHSVIIFVQKYLYLENSNPELSNYYVLTISAIAPALSWIVK